MNKSRGLSFIELMIAVVVLSITAMFSYKIIHGIARQQVADNSTKTANMIAEAVIDNFKYLSTFRNEWFDRDVVNIGGTDYPVSGTYHLFYIPGHPHSLMPAVLEQDTHRMLEIYSSNATITRQPPPEHDQSHFNILADIQDLDSTGERKGLLTIEWNEGPRARSITRNFSLLPRSTRTPGFTLKQRFLDAANGACTPIPGLVIKTFGVEGVPVYGTTNINGEVILYGLTKNVTGHVDGMVTAGTNFYNKHPDNNKEYTHSRLPKEIDFTFPDNVVVADNPLADFEDLNNIVIAGAAIPGSPSTVDECEDGVDMWAFGSIAGNVKAAVGNAGVEDYLLHVRPTRQHVWMDRPFREELTDSNGNYVLENVMPGEYYIVPVGTARAIPIPDTPQRFFQVPMRRDINNFDDGTASDHHPATFAEHGVRWPIDPNPIDASNSVPLAPDPSSGDAYAGMGWSGGTTINPNFEVNEFQKSNSACAKCLEVTEGNRYDSGTIGTVNPNDLDASEFIVKKMADLTVNLARANAFTPGAAGAPGSWSTSGFTSAHENVQLLAFNNPYYLEGHNLGINGYLYAKFQDEWGGLFIIDEGYLNRNGRMNDVETDFMAARANSSGQVVFRNIANPITARTDSDYPYASPGLPAVQSDSIYVAPFSYGNGLAPVLLIEDSISAQWKWVVYTGGAQHSGDTYRHLFKVIPSGYGFSSINNAGGNITRYTPSQDTAYAAYTPFFPNVNLKGFDVGAADTTASRQILLVPNNRMSNIYGYILDINKPEPILPGGYDHWVPPTPAPGDPPSPPISSGRVHTWGIERENELDANSPGWFTFNYEGSITESAAFPPVFDFNPTPGNASNNRVLPSLGYFPITTHAAAYGDARFVTFSYTQDIADETMRVFFKTRARFKFYDPNANPQVDMQTGDANLFTLWNVNYEITDAGGNILNNGVDNIATLADLSLLNTPADPPKTWGVRTNADVDIPTFRDFTGGLDSNAGYNPRWVTGTQGGINLPPATNYEAHILVNTPVDRVDPVYVRLTDTINTYDRQLIDKKAPLPGQIGIIARQCDTALTGWDNMAQCAPYKNMTFAGIPIHILYPEFYGTEETAEMYLRAPVRAIEVFVADASSPTGELITDATIRIWTSRQDRVNAGGRWLRHPIDFSTDGTYGQVGSIRLDHNGVGALQSPKADFIEGKNVWIRVRADGFYDAHFIEERGFNQIVYWIAWMTPRPSSVPEDPDADLGL